MRRSILSYSLIRKELKKGKSVREIARKYDVTRQAIYWHIYKHKRKKGKRNLCSP